jgi:hypothetical protein
MSLNIKMSVIRPKAILPNGLAMCSADLDKLLH